MNNLSGPVDNYVNNFCGETGGNRRRDGYYSPPRVPGMRGCRPLLTSALRPRTTARTRWTATLGSRASGSTLRPWEPVEKIREETEKDILTGQR